MCEDGSGSARLYDLWSSTVTHDDCVQDVMGPLLEAVRTRDMEAAAQWAAGDHWANLEQMIAAVGTSSSHSEAGEWTCPHCTFLNPPRLAQCEMCSLPRYTDSPASFRTVVTLGSVLEPLLLILFSSTVEFQ